MNPPIAESPTPAVHRSRPFPVTVILCGLASTTLALLMVYVLEHNSEDFHIMGWYANYILPIGALLVGLIASSGYGIASWLTGMKITKKVFLLMLALQVGAYFAAQYIEFKDMNLYERETGRPIGFIEYYDAVARSFAWKQKDGTAGAPLGLAGYFFRALELVGFALGGLVVPAIMAKAAYCEPCQRYMSKRELAYVPASVAARKIKKKDTAGMEAHAKEQDAAFEAGKVRVEALNNAAEAGNIDAVQTELAALKAERKLTLKLPARFVLELIHCKSCRFGRLRTALLIGDAQHAQTTELGVTTVPEEFVRIFRNK